MIKATSLWCIRETGRTYSTTPGAESTERECYVAFRYRITRSLMRLREPSVKTRTITATSKEVA